MVKRKSISAGLHSELAEYTSLLRALRTSNTLDVTNQLIKAPLFRNSQTLRDELANTEHDEDLGSDQNGPASQPSSVDMSLAKVSSTAGPSTHPGKQTRSTSTVKTKRDTWTRWPLLADDVAIPEWGIGDEISHIVSQVLKHQSRSPDPSALDGAASDRDLSDDDTDPPAYMPYLVDIGEHFLSRILALLAFNVPVRPQSMQNRLEPLDWRMVLGAVAATGDASFANSRIIDNVNKRMEIICGSAMDDTTECNGSYRIQQGISSMERLTASLDAADADLFKFPDAADIVLQPPQQKGKRKGIAATKKPKKAKRRKLNHENLDVGSIS